MAQVQTSSKPGKAARKRDTRVELARLIACLLVVGIHLLPTPLIEGKYTFSRVFLSCIFADGVALFWMITGCFFFSRRYGKVLAKGVTRILVPLLLASLLGILVNLLPLPGFSPTNLSALFNDFIHWRNGVNGMEHLWYLYVNLVVVLLFPLFKRIVIWLDEDPMRDVWFLGITAGLFLVNDLFQNQLFHFSHYLIGGAIPAGIEMIWGHILYRWRHRISGWKMAGLFGGIFIGLNLLRAALQMHQYGISPQNTAYLYWFSFSGILSSALLLLLSFALFHPRRYKKSKVVLAADSLVTSVASYSFAVYLIHYPVLRIINGLGITNAISAHFFSNGTSLLLETGYVLLMIVFVYILSVLASWGIDWFWKWIQKYTKKQLAAQLKNKKSKRAPSSKPAEKPGQNLQIKPSQNPIPVSGAVVAKSQDSTQNSVSTPNHPESFA